MKFSLRLSVANNIRQPFNMPKQLPAIFQQPQNCYMQMSRRRLTTTSKGQGAAFHPQAPVLPSLPPAENHSQQMSTTRPPLSVLPLSQVLRTWMITSVSCSPRLMDVTTSILRRMLKSKNSLFSLQRNPVLKALLWHTFYKQFCAGETPAQVAQECRRLRQQGYGGVILEYALEVLEDDSGHKEHNVALWRQGVLDTIDLASPGDFVALKWSGMGSAAMHLMKKNQMPSESMAEAIEIVCSAAAARNVSLLPSAEETWTLDGYHSWSLNAQRKFNRNGQCVVYNTYQAYLKRAPRDLEKHLSNAKEGGYTLGVKVVRGAYLNTEERSKIWPTIEGTHHSFDSIASALLQRQNNDFLFTKSWPKVKVVLATHNANSVNHAQTLRQNQVAAGKELVPLAYSQLQGMADEVSCSLLAASRPVEREGEGGRVVSEKVFKFTPWGPIGECLNYLLRRAAENKDATSRTQGTRDAMMGEIFRRVSAGFGWKS